MFLLYILDTYIILVKYLQRPPLVVSINSCYMNHDAGKTFSEISNMSHSGSIQKQSSAGI